MSNGLWDDAHVAKGYLACLAGEEMKAKDAEISSLHSEVASLRNQVKLIAEEGGDPLDKWERVNEELHSEREWSEALVKALEQIRKVSQFDHAKSQIIGSEEYEGAWLDCVEIAREVLEKHRETR